LYLFAPSNDRSVWVSDIGETRSISHTARALLPLQTHIDLIYAIFQLESLKPESSLTEGS